MIKCKSSNLDYFSWDSETKTLEVCFTNGNKYEYYNVTESAYNAFKDADSHGKHFAKHVKDSFKFQKQQKKEREKDKKDE